ncbi:hypothetical protein [Cellulomonas sp. HD19AZ1]|uniref:hypothetical protein n=1 Tax=Cellulomonas sp. HD19AZ1 TaxID=2559593 RepID=UPI001070BB25|nr:hypothetical protein [Cellulomonas sp. HD19AZ1]TFH70627.1 hypothetical protein E4A51_12785 [Cellulomonas sp. HD19AZ1]
MSRAGVRASAVALGLVVAGAVLSACAPADDGPLTGPRPEADDVHVCLPAGTDRQVYFGEPLTNTGDEPVEITRITGSGDNLDTVHYFVDVEGPARGELLGGFAWPAGDDLIGPEEQVLARMAAPDGTVVEPGATVSLIVQAVPESPDEYAAVSRTVVYYRSGGDTYREPVLVEYGVAPGAQC